MTRFASLHRDPPRRGVPRAASRLLALAGALPAHALAAPTLLADYPREALGALLGFVLMGALVLALVRANRARARSLAEAEQNRALLASVLDATPDIVFLKDSEGRYGLVNRAYAELVDRHASEIVGHNDFDLYPAATAEAFRSRDREVIEQGRVMRCIETAEQHDGRREMFDTIKAPVRTADGQLVGVLGVARPVTAEHQTAERLQLAAQVFENAAEGIMITSPEGVIEVVNPAFTRITGFTAEEARGKRPSLLHSGRHSELFYQRMWRTVTREGVWKGEIWNRRKSGEIYPEWLNISPVRDSGGRVLHYLGIFSDITAVKLSEAQLEHMAHHDALTGLPNRTLLGDRIDTALRRARRDACMVAVIFLDLDHFKDINDSFGHAVGDEVLQQVAGRLLECVRDEDTVARLGGDEFVILMESIDSIGQADLAGERVLACLTPPINLEHQEFFIGASIGISIFPRDGEDAEGLVGNADTAMYQAKRQGRNTIQRYSEHHTESARARMRQDTALRRAVEQSRFEVWLQPQVELASGRLIGFEALCRWPDEERGMVPPDEFIPLAENNGLIVQIGEFVLRESCRQIARWRAAGLEPPPIAVNVSGRQLRRLDFLASLCAILEEEGCRPEWLELEVTESDILKDAEPAIATLHGIREMGVGLSLDDFGTGFSSLSYLKRLPVDTLKIDRSFTQGLPGDANDRAIVQAVLAMGRSLGITVLAEGVENQAQAHALRLMGCALAQGYHFGRPARAAALTELLAQGRVTLEA